MTARDVDLVTHRIDAITRAATRIRAHLADLHYLAYERAVADTVKVRETKTDHVPRVLDEAPRARHVWEHLLIEIERCEATLVGLERQVLGYFMVTATSAEVTRGSLIRADEHARLLARQRARAADGEYVPARLVEQPPHPGKGRR